MANQEYLKILKQGVGTWNQFRKEYAGTVEQPDLRGANLRGANLTEANLRDTILSDANLSGALFLRADLSGALLVGTDLRGADLTGADLSGADLSGADLDEATVRWTIFGDVDLSEVKGLETVWHLGPLTLGIDSIIKSQGKIPKAFLRRAGIPESIIEMIPSMISSLKSIDFYSCFISYSSKDQDFADRLYADLQSKGVRCWFAPEDMKVGDKIRPRIEESIHMYDKLLLVLSEHSITSNWVAYEVERALNKEPEGIPNVLFPIRLDDTIMKSQAGWADDIRRTRHIGDFSQWKNRDAYRKEFNRLLRALKAGT